LAWLLPVPEGPGPPGGSRSPASASRTGQDYTSTSARSTVDRSASGARTSSGVQPQCRVALRHLPCGPWDREVQLSKRPPCGHANLPIMPTLLPLTSCTGFSCLRASSAPAPPAGFCSCNAGPRAYGNFNVWPCSAG
jgi:hypothetical protein